MSFQPYVPPEQLMKDRSDYARKGIARGRSVVAMEFADGVLFVAENPSATLHKISEIDEQGYVGIGGSSEELTQHLRDDYREDWDLGSGVRAAVRALGNGGERTVPTEDLEVAVLDRTRGRRKFRRLSDGEVIGILAQADASEAGEDSATGAGTDEPASGGIESPGGSTATDD